MPECQAINVLSLPLFYFLSGLFFKDYGSFYRLVINKVNKLLVPFLSFFVLGFLLFCVTTKLLPLYLLIQPVFENDILNYPIWFLISLFFANLIYGIVTHISKSGYVRGVVVAILGCCGYMLSVYDVYLPLFMSTTLSTMPIFFCGCLLKRLTAMEHLKCNGLILWISIVILACYILLSSTYDLPKLYYMGNIWRGNPILALIISLVMILSLLIVCRAMKWLPIVSYIGRNTMITLCVHFLIIWVFGLAYMAVLGEKASPTILSIVTLAGSWIATPVLLRYLPFIVARRNLIKL